MYYFKKQAAISAGCLIIAIVASRVDYHVYAMFSGWIYLIANVLLFLTKFLGTELNGAKRWIYLGPLSFQPAEMAKVAVILFLPTCIFPMLSAVGPRTRILALSGIRCIILTR